MVFVRAVVCMDACFGGFWGVFGLCSVVVGMNLRCDVSSVVSRRFVLGCLVCRLSWFLVCV